MPEIDGKLLVNRDRATEVLDRFGLAGMIALDPINVTYLTNVVTIGMKFINEYPGFRDLRCRSAGADLSRHRRHDRRLGYGQRHPRDGGHHALRLRRR